MSRYLPPLNALRAFEAAARHGSFTKAANELCVTPGAVSRQVQTLEEHLGTTLFTRMNREVVISPQGQKYREALTSAFDQINSSTSALKSERKLNISSYLTFSMRWLIPRLSTFTRQQANCPITLTTTPPNIFDVVSGIIDIAILSGQGDWSGVHMDKLFPLELEPVVSPEFLKIVPLDEPDNLAQVPLLHSTARPDDWADWITDTGINTVTPSSGIMFESSSLAFEAALHGVGAAMGQRVLLSSELSDGRLVAPFDKPFNDGTSFYLVYSNRVADDRRIKSFRKWILAEAGEFSERFH